MKGKHPVEEWDWFAREWGSAVEQMCTSAMDRMDAGDGSLLRVRTLRLEIIF